MWPILLADLNKTWLLIPLSISISLVYAASRFEAIGSILRRAFRVNVLILGGMGLVILLLMFLSRNL